MSTNIMIIFSSSYTEFVLNGKNKTLCPQGVKEVKRKRNFNSKKKQFALF